MKFLWNNEKNAANERKHGVRFEDAAHAFDDPFAVLRRDRVVEGEARWQTMAMVDRLLLVVVHTLYEQGDGECARIISARQATRRERKIYEED